MSPLSTARLALIWHLANCVTCLAARYDGRGDSLCINGARLWRAARIPPRPTPWPKGLEPSFIRDNSPPLEE